MDLEARWPLNDAEGWGLRGVDAQRQDPVPTADVEIAPRNENEEEPGCPYTKTPSLVGSGLSTVVVTGIILP